MQINPFSDDELEALVGLLSQDNISVFPKEGKHCESRDIFQARLDNLFDSLRDPLLIAVCGEIGNNSFDHNSGSWRDLSGVYFESLDKDRLIILADHGQGIKKTLSRVLPNILSDKDAVEAAFTKVISGRSPEQRGNGLKFVSSVAKKNFWELFLQSGQGIARISKGKIFFADSPSDVKGCLVVIKY